MEDPALQVAGSWERAGQCWEESNLPKGWSVGLPVTGNGTEGFGDLAEQTKEKGLCLRRSGCTKSFGHGTKMFGAAFEEEECGSRLRWVVGRKLQAEKH